MPILKEGPCNFEPHELDMLHVVGSAEFPWYLARATYNFPVMTHDLMRRTDEPTQGIPQSPFYAGFRKLLNRICAMNNIDVRTVFRMALNLTFSDPSLHGDPHIDHTGFSHKNMLIYLNSFQNGATYLFDDDGKEIIETISPKKDHFVVFDGCQHAAGFCKPREFRMIFVATFDGDVN